MSSHNNNFLMTDLALRQLKLSREKVQGLQVQPNKLTIILPGETLIISPATNRKGVFATMIVQIPVQGGHRDGSLLIFRGDQSRKFENFVESSNLFYYTVYLSDCSCRMEPISCGTRVTLMFDLICSDPAKLFPSVGADVVQMLGQLQPNSADRLLAIPLDKSEQSFSSLSTRSRRLVDLVSSLNFIDIRLAIVCRYRIGKSSQRTGCECCRKRGCPCQEVVMQEISQERIVTSKWLDTSNQELQFDQLDIDMKEEIVGDGPVFFDTPTEEKLDDQTWVLEQWYYRPMLVFWHKERSVHFDCLYRFGALMDNLTMDSPNGINEVITFCCERPDILKKEQNSSVLLKLCLKANERKQVLRLLEVISVHEGIKNAEMVNTLSQIVQVIGWNECAPWIIKFISVHRAQEQMQQFVDLVLSLLINCNQGALELSNQIDTILSTGDLIKTLDISILALCVDMFMRFDQKPIRLVDLANQIKEKLPTFKQLLQLLVCVQDRLNARPAEQITKPAISWYCNLCLHLASVAIPPETQPQQVHSAVKLYVSSGDETLLETFIQHLTSPENQENNVLKSLLKLESLWKSAEVSTENKQVVYSLVDRRIQWLIAIPKPKASWAHPDYIVVGHPAVQEFMRSDNQNMTYANFNNIQHARNWARKHFSRCQIAQAEANGAGKNAYCIVTKHKKRYNGENVKYAVCHQELMSLIDLRLKRLGDAPCTIVVNSNTEEIFSVVVQSDGVIKPENPVPPVDVKPTVPTTNNGILSSVKPNIQQSRKLILKSRVRRIAPKCSPTPRPVSQLVVIKKAPDQQSSSLLNTAVLVGPTVSTSNTTPKRPGVAKRPLTAFSSPASPVVVQQIKTEIPHQRNNPVKRELIDPSVNLSSPSKRVKLEPHDQ